MLKLFLIASCLISLICIIISYQIIANKPNDKVFESVVFTQIANAIFYITVVFSCIFVKMRVK